MASAGNITAVLTLNASNFTSGLQRSIDKLTEFKSAITSFNTDFGKISRGIADLKTHLQNLVTELQSVNLAFSNLKNFNTLSLAIQRISKSLVTLSSDSLNAQNGINILTAVFQAWSEAVGNTRIQIEGVTRVVREMGSQGSSSANQINSAFKQAQQSLLDMGKGVQPLAKIREQADLMKAEFEKARVEMLQFAQYGVEAFNSIDAQSNTTKSQIKQLEAEFERARAELMEFARSGIVHFNEISTAEKKVEAETNKVTASFQRQNSTMSQATARTNQLASATSRLGKAMSSLRMIGSLVGSMLAYNFAHKLLVATGETIHAKSEMEGYFQMLHFGQGEIDKFNQALDDTVTRFQRVNKYSLGETISSIGVEFNLTTDEMIKAMDVTSMITSEYLRAGRNANEASLAVKDVLQGQFQRLSRETGVKGEQLKEAGWNGDVTDVNSLLDALRKVAEDRNWDVFAEKANSLNDILTISQNRFGEWSADMVNTVQPAIVGTFNAIMDVGGIFAQQLSGIWQWLNGDGWTQGALKVALYGTAIVGLVGALIKLRTGASLVQVGQMGLLRTISATILGLNAEAVATSGLTGAIAQSITGLTAEQVAQVGSTQAIYGKILGLDMEVVAEEGLVGAINSSIISREAESVATVEQTGANVGFLGALTSVIAGEELATGTTLTLAEALGVLTAEMLMNPITWFVGALMALAGAFYVATGGLSDHWEKMKQFNQTMDESDDIIKSNNDYLKGLGETLGTDSQIYQTTADAVEGFNDKIKSSKELVEKYNKELDNLEVKLTGKFDANLQERYGFSDEQLSKFRDYGILDEGQSTYQRALDVIYLQETNAEKTQTDILDKMDQRHAQDEEIADKTNQIKEHEANLIKHSAEHNTSEDWWGGTWSGFLAGLDSIQLWLDYATEDIATWLYDFNKAWNELPNQLGEAWNNLTGSFPDLGKMFWDWIDDVGKSLGDSWKDLQEMWENNIVKPLTNLFGGEDGENGGVGGLSAKKINPMNLIKKLFDFAEGIDISWVTDWLNNNIITPITTAFNNFMTDPLSYIDSVFGISDFINGLFGMSGGDDPNDINWAMTFLNNNIIAPLQNAFNMFMTDPMSFLMGGVSFALDSLINALFPSDGGVSILTWADTNIIQPLGSSIYNGIMNIPIVSDILSLFGLVNGDNTGASQKGSDIGTAFKTKVEDVIRSIPILGDVLQMLGVIPNANPDAHAKGQGVGENIKQGEQQGHTGTSQNVASEMSDVVRAISNAVGEAYKVAQQVGQAIWNGINSILQRASPGFIHDQINAEFGTDIPNAILSSKDLAYTNAQAYGQSISDGISSVNMNTLGMDAMATEYQNDALMISTSTQMIGTDTTTAFNDMQMAVNTTTANMSGNVTTTYTGMQTKQASLLNTMKTQNQTAYNDMYTKSNTSLIQMRDSTSKTTQQMTQAWDHMKNQIVATANKLKVDSTNHFNQLSNTIGSFYRKIQNPSNWGSAGSPSLRSGVRKATTGRRVASSIRSRSGGYAGGGTGYKGTSTMTIAQLKKTICPNGDCGNLFDGYNPTQRVDVDSFLMSVMGEHGFGWNDWSGRHYNHIKTKTDEWDMKSPTIQLKGGIPTDSKFKVKDFESGQPKITFDEFEGMARSIFTAIPYRFYYDSSWKGSWLGALQAGACNCWDGAHALLAFANTCGFSGSIAHGSWNGVPHVWAVIEGRKMDTTGMQQRGTWTPSASAGGFSRPISAPSGATNEVHIHINMDNNTIYGVDDLDSRMQEAVEKGLQENFNNNYTIGAV